MAITIIIRKTINYCCCQSPSLASTSSLSHIISYSIYAAIKKNGQRNALINCNRNDKEMTTLRQQSLYERAVYQLNCLQSNAQTLAKIQQNRQQMLHSNLNETLEYLQRLGISLDDIDKLNVVHIAGTKGKGSTAAFLETILRRLGFKTGFYSSPHLIFVRERFRINGSPISEQCFAEHFFHVLERLKEYGLQRQFSVHDHQHLPAYFKFLTLLAFHLFLEQRVDVAIVEVGIGGEFDCTNVVRKPIACGLTTLDFDHTRLLGKTLPEIAWHKAGIAKAGSVLLTIQHPPEAMKVIQEQCAEKKCQLMIVPSSLASYSWPKSYGAIELGIPGQQQHSNASLALQLARIWLHRTKHLDIDGHQIINTSNNKETISHVDERDQLAHLAGFGIPVQMADALEQCKWPGRSQLLRRNNVLFHLDGAHTPQSIQFCADWFRESSRMHSKSLQLKSSSHSTDVLRVLLFHCIGDRDSSLLLPKFKDCAFNTALFCPIQLEVQQSPLSKDNTNLNVDHEADLQRCERDRQIWHTIVTDSGENESLKTDLDLHQNSCSNADILPSISYALERIERLAKNDRELHVLVTGSLHLVGGVLALLDPQSAL